LICTQGIIGFLIAVLTGRGSNDRKTGLQAKNTVMIRKHQKIEVVVGKKQFLQLLVKTALHLRSGISKSVAIQLEIGLDGRFG
jgi:hypothetical protein